VYTPKAYNNQLQKDNGKRSEVKQLSQIRKQFGVSLETRPGKQRKSATDAQKNIANVQYTHKPNNKQS